MSEPANQPDNLVLRVRQALSLHQTQLANLIGVKRHSVMRWERDPALIPPVILALFRLIEVNPTAALAVLQAQGITPKPKREKKKRPEPRSEFTGAGDPPNRAQRGTKGSSVPEHFHETDAWKFGF